MAGVVPQIFSEDDGDGIGFFAGGAAGDPKAQRAMLARGESWRMEGKTILRRDSKASGSRKKAGDVDEHVAVKLVEFFGVFLDVSKIIFEGFDTVQDDAALDAAMKRGLFILGEIHTSGLTQ